MARRSLARTSRRGASLRGSNLSLFALRERTHRAKIGFSGDRAHESGEDPRRVLKIGEATDLNLSMHIAVGDADTTGSDSAARDLNRIGIVAEEL